jgi:type IV secretory pathway VirB3-like protein
VEQDQPLDEEAFDMAATRPALTFGLPHTLSALLLLAAIVGLFLVDTGDFETDTIFDVVWIGTIAMVWTAAKIMLRADYHGWDIFLSWLRLDARFLDTKEWGGAHLSSLPLRSIYRCGVFSDADW